MLNLKESADPVRLGGIGFVLANQIEDETSLEARTVVMGHLQRGGSPTPFDRVLATSLGTKAVELMESGEFGYMSAVKGNKLIKFPLDKAAAGPKTVPPAYPLIRSARSVGTCFGD